MNSPIMLAQLDVETLTRIEEKLDKVLDQLAPSEGWLTIAQAAKAWEVSERTVSRWAKDGNVECKGTGKLRMVRR